MSFQQSFFGSVDLPDSDDSRPPRHRPDGVRPDHDVAFAQAIDPGARGQAHDQERRDIGRGQHADFHEARAEGFGGHGVP